MDCQQQAAANIAAADEDLTAPSSHEASAGGGENDHGELCVRLRRNQRIIIANSGFNGISSGEGGNPNDREANAGLPDSREMSGSPIRLTGGREEVGRDGKKSEQLPLTLRFR